MTFSIRELPNDKLRQNGTVAEVVLGEHRETFPLITTLWTIQDYQRQWHGAIEAMVKHQVTSGMLVTDVQPHQNSAGITYWAMFREGERVYVQERLMRFAPPAELLLIPKEAEKVIPPRIQGSDEEHKQVSEWLVLMSDLVKFLEKIAGRSRGQ